MKIGSTAHQPHEQAYDQQLTTIVDDAVPMHEHHAVQQAEWEDPPCHPSVQAGCRNNRVNCLKSLSAAAVRQRNVDLPANECIKKTGLTKAIVLNSYRK